jgi:hypothetical protein
MFKPQWKEYPSSGVVLAQWILDGQIICSEFTIVGSTVTGGWKHEAS